MNAMDRFRRECTAFFEALEAGAQAAYRRRIIIRALHARRGEGGQARLSNKEESS